jgi:hypothetical protein
MWHWKVKWLKLVKLKFVWYLDLSETVDSSVVRMVFGLVNWVLGRIFGAGETEAESYVTMIVCWQQNILGWLDKVWKGTGSEGSKGVVRHLLLNLKGRQYKRLLSYITICNAVPTEISCGCLKDTNPVQTEHHNINKCYGCDQRQAFWTWHWTACLVICAILERLWHRNLQCILCISWTRSTDVNFVRFYKGANNSLARTISRCHKTESLVSLERGVFPIAELHVFSCYRGWKDAWQGTRAISTTSRRELSFFLQGKALKQIYAFLKWYIKGTCTIECHHQNLRVRV